MKTLGYYNGKYDELDKMTVPMNDRACSFGDGVYDSAFAHNHTVFRLSEHIDRIFGGMELLKINPPCSKEEMFEIITEMVKKVDASDTFVYWQVTRGTMPRDHAFPDGMKSNLWIIIREKPLRDTYMKIKLISKEDTRFLHCNIKSLNLIPSVLASAEAAKAGAYECVFHRGERVTECAHSNINMIKNGVFITPPADEYILAGTARAHLIEKCHELSVPVEIRPFTMAELEAADEIIVSSAGSLCMQVAELDSKPVGGKAPELIKKLQDSLLEDYYRETEGK